MIAPIITRAALWSLALSLLIGQLVRIPVAGQSGGLLVSDLAVVLVLIASYIQCGTQPKAVANYLLLTTPFIFWALFTLIINSSLLDIPEITIAALYWVRTSCYLLLLPALAYLTRDKKAHQTVSRSFLLAGSALIILGLFQFVWFPNLSALPPVLLSLAGTGWDPHEGRAVSTWLDPNFFGVFVSLFLLYVTSLWFQATSHRLRIQYVVIIAASATTLILTQSRSSLLAVALASVVLSPVIVLRLTRQPLRQLLPALASVLSLCLLIGLIAAFVLGDRLAGLLQFDPTVQARAEAFVATWHLAQDQPWFGVGYNAFQFAAEKSGVTTNLALHSRAGADNSWLTILVTTGLPGVLLFALPWLVIITTGISQWLRYGEVSSLMVAASVLVLIIHSQFVNSFLYAHLLLAVAYITALSSPPPTTTS